MSKYNEIKKITALANQIFKAAGSVLPSNKHMSEARHHIQQVIKCLNKVQSEQSKKQVKSTQFESWWGNIVSGTAKLSQNQISNQSISKSLNVLQNMIDVEQNKIDTIDDEVNNSNYKDESSKFLIE